MTGQETRQDEAYVTRRNEARRDAIVSRVTSLFLDTVFAIVTRLATEQTALSCDRDIDETHEFNEHTVLSHRTLQSYTVSKSRNNGRLRSERQRTTHCYRIPNAGFPQISPFHPYPHLPTSRRASSRRFDECKQVAPRVCVVSRTNHRLRWAST